MARLRQDRRQERITEAAQRQAAYDTLSPQKKLKLLDQYGFVAKKQRARLEAQVEAAKAPKKAK